MSILLDILYIFAAIFYLPAFLFKGKHRIGLKERLGLYSAQMLNILKNNKFHIWIHAVSVGEIKTAAVLIKQLRVLLPQTNFLISTITPTGNAVAQKLATKNDLVIYLPFDFSWIVRKTINLADPKLLLIMETEIWPNLINEAHRRNIPIVVANGRISDKAFPHYKKGAVFFKQALARITLLCMQTKKDADRVIDLGAKKEKVQVVGNMKFDQFGPLAKNNPPNIGLEKGERLIIAGSTHDNEEEIIARVFLRLKQKYKDIRLLICPRHTHRSIAIRQILINLNLESVFISELRQCKKIVSQDTVYILDVMGELSEFYQIAHIVFIGGSLIEHGGQNPIEPARYAKAIIFGKYMFNFEEIKKMFLSNKAALCVGSEEGLFETLNALLSDEEKRRMLSLNAQELVKNNKGAAEKIIGLLKENNLLKV